MGKILTNRSPVIRIHQTFPHQSFALYSKCQKKLFCADICLNSSHPLATVSHKTLVVEDFVEWQVSTQVKKILADWVFKLQEIK